MVLASGPINICQFKVKGLDVRETPQNDMKPSASMPQSPLLSKPVDLTAASAHTNELAPTQRTNMESNNTENHSTINITSTQVLSHHNKSLESASVSTNSTTNLDSIAMTVSENILESAALPQCLTKPIISTKNHFELASLPQSNEEAATPRNMGSTSTNKNDTVLPSVSPSDTQSPTLLSHPNKHYNMKHSCPTKMAEACSSIDTNIVNSSYVPEHAISIPQNNLCSLPVSNNTMGLVLTSHDKLQTVLTPKNIIEYKSVKIFGNQSTLSNDMPSSSLALKESRGSSAVMELASRPLCNMEFPASARQNGSMVRNIVNPVPQDRMNDTGEVGSRPKLTVQVTADQIEMENTIKAKYMDENAMGSTAVNQEVPRKSQNSMDLSSSLLRDIKKTNSTSSMKVSEVETNKISTNSSESMSNNVGLTLQNDIETSPLVPSANMDCTSKMKTKLDTNDKMDKTAVKNAGLPQNKTEDGPSMPQNTNEHQSKPKTITRCSSIDKMDRNLEKPCSSEVRKTTECKTGSSMLHAKAGTTSKHKTVTKSPSIDKVSTGLSSILLLEDNTSMPQNTSEYNKIYKKMEKTSSCQVRRTAESKSESTLAFKKETVSGPSVLQAKAGTPSKNKIVTKSPSIDKVDKMFIRSSLEMPQNKMVTSASAPKTPMALPSKPKAVPKSPSVDKIDRKSSKKETVPSDRRSSLKPPWRGGGGGGAGLVPSGYIRRSESSLSVNAGLRSRAGLMRAATSLPHIPKSSLLRPCLLVALRPTNLQQQKDRFFQEQCQYEPQFEYEEELTAVVDKYREGSGLFLQQAVGIMECVLKKYGSYENFEEVTGGIILPKSQVWAAVRKYLQKEGCVGEVVVRLSDELLSQAVMVVENCRPTLTINLSGARQHWLEGMLRHEIGTHYLRGVNNSLQPWASSEHRRQLGLKPANPTEEGLASLHSVLLRKQPFLWRAALLYYTVYHAANMSFSQLFHHIHRFVNNPEVRWEYCLRAKRGQTDTSKPGCFSKDQVYLDGILRILRHRRSIDFQLLTALGKVSFEDMDRLRSLAVLSRTRIPHFMMDTQKYMAQLDHIVAMNELDDSELEQLLP